MIDEQRQTVQTVNNTMNDGEMLSDGRASIQRSMNNPTDHAHMQQHATRSIGESHQCACEPLSRGFQAFLMHMSEPFII